MNANRERRGYILGLDLGVASIGWCCIECDDTDGFRPIGLLRDESGRTLLGSHLFESGTDGGKLGEAGIAQGKDKPRNIERRTARLMRRQAWRRARRKRKLLKLLIEHRLLPSPTELAGRLEGKQPDEVGADLRRPLDIDAYMKALDKVLARTWLAGKGHADHQRMPYLMRAAAAAGPVEREAFGRALYHLAQRRGFESNRRADAKKHDDEDKGKVKAAIGDLAQKIEAFATQGGTPTLGAYLASLNPDEQRLRGRWTSRGMYKHEFASMWDRQAGPLSLQEEARTAIHKAIFFQRPLKNQSNLIGHCSLIPSEKRCPVAHRLYQRFRVLQAINHLQLAPAVGAPRWIDDSERALLLGALTGEGDLTFAAARKLLKVKRDASFNLERGDEKKITGHRTDAKLRGVLGIRFEAFSEEDKDRMVDDLRSFRLPESLVRRGRRRWGLTQDEAATFASIDLEEGYAPLSLAAIRRLLPHMETGMPYATARKQEFPESMRSSEPAAELPPVLKAMDEVRNPSVMRTLTEVRKLVNALTRRLGKPSVIRVELAREIKQPRTVRERMTTAMRDREKSRSAIVERIEKEARITRPTREDIEKVMLAEECGWVCPYTGPEHPIGWDTLLGPHSQFDIEHIWPRWRSLDDSLLNKTLCYHEENRSRKRGFTPREAYGGNAEKFGEIIDRLRRFKTDPFTKAAKIARFEAEEIPADFTNRHLADTRYIAAAAADYLGLLYGGRIESAAETGMPGTRRVDVCTGGLTAWLRSGWGIAGLLGDTGEKNRADHRHHAVDAVVVALSDARAVQALARAASEADKKFKRRAFESIDEPWAGFRDQVDNAIAGVVVSHRQSRRVSGPLHDQSIYSKPITLPVVPANPDEPPAKGRKKPSKKATAPTTEHRIRKELHKLSVSDIRDGKVVDKRALAAIRAKLAELGKPEPTPQELTKIFSDPANAPMVRGADGKMVRLRKVRVRADAGRRIGNAEDVTERWVKPNNNHHLVVYAEVGSDGNDKEWGDFIVPIIDAYERRAAGQRVVNSDLGPGRRLLFTLTKNEYIEMDMPHDATRHAIYRVMNISEGQSEVMLHFDGRPSTDLRADKKAGKKDERIRIPGDKLRKLRAKKIAITYLGEVKHAGG